MANYRTLPFATYDLAVYLPGGAVLLLVAHNLFATVVGGQLMPGQTFPAETTINSATQIVLWLSASYLVGHLGAFLSTYTVERFIHNALGFPSDVWLEKEERTQSGVGRREALKSIFQENIRSFRWSWSAGLSFLFQFPLWIFYIIFAAVLPIGFYIPKLPDGLLPDVRKVFDQIGSSIELKKETRWEKIIEHYVSNHYPPAYSRMYNYLVIYGALRLLSFILLLSCWLIIIKSGIALCSGNWEWSMRRSVLLGACATSSFLSMMAFAKFNRRYFEETILALLFSPKNG